MLPLKPPHDDHELDIEGVGAGEGSGREIGGAKEGKPGGAETPKGGWANGVEDPNGRAEGSEAGTGEQGKTEEKDGGRREAGGGARTKREGADEERETGGGRGAPEEEKGGRAEGGAEAKERRAERKRGEPEEKSQEASAE